MLALPVLIVLGVVIAILYWLVVKGYLFKGLLLVAGSLCIWIVLSAQPAFQGIVFHFGGTSFTWASTCPMILVVLCLLTTKG